MHGGEKTVKKKREKKNYVCTKLYMLKIQVFYSGFWSRSLQMQVLGATPYWIHRISFKGSWLNIQVESFLFQLYILCPVLGIYGHYFMWGFTTVNIRLTYKTVFHQPLSSCVFLHSLTGAVCVAEAAIATYPAAETAGTVLGVGGSRLGASPAGSVPFSGRLQPRKQVRWRVLGMRNQEEIPLSLKCLRWKQMSYILLWNQLWGLKTFTSKLKNVIEIHNLMLPLHRNQCWD